MELKAALEGLLVLTRPTTITIHPDSAYLANAFTEKVEVQELDRLCQCARHAHDSKLQVNAGHGINYRNIALIHKIPHLTELNIGHAIVSRAIFVGWENAVREMLARMENYNG